MANKEIISSNQYTWIIFSIITSITVLQIPGMLISLAGHDGWLSVLLAWLLDIAVAILYAYMASRFPGENYVQYSETILGKYIGKIVGIIFPLFFMLVAIIFIRSLAELISSIFLPYTPIEVILGTGYFLIGYGVRKGIESIARASEVLGPIYFISMILLILLVIPDVRIERVMPQLAEGYSQFIIGGVFLLNFFGVCAIMGMYIPIINKQKHGFIAKFTAVTMASPIICLIVAFSTAVLCDEGAQNLVNPGLALARYISIGRVFERVEIIWMMIAIAAGIVTSANLIWAFCQGVSHSVKLSTYKPLVYPAVLLAFIASITSFQGYVDLYNFLFYTFPIIAVFVEAILELFLFVMAVILKKRGKAA